MSRWVWMLASAAVIVTACGRPATGPAPAPAGQVTADGGCKQSRNCKVWGWCSHQGDQCVAASDADCGAADVCKNGGLCSFRNGQCVALDDGDCERSEWCDKFGWCSAAQNVCVR